MLVWQPGDRVFNLSAQAFGKVIRPGTIEGWVIVQLEEHPEEEVQWCEDDLCGAKFW